MESRPVSSAPPHPAPPAHIATWSDVRDEVVRRIRDSVWRPGELLPTETELAAEFDCARATVSRALNALAETGVLDRKRRAGTRVALTPVRRATFEIPVIRVAVEGLGAVYRPMLLERALSPAPESVAGRMGFAPGTDLLHIRTLHLADGRPHCYEDRWVAPDAALGLIDAPLHEISANEWLVRNIFFSHGEIALSAEPAGEREAELLEAPLGAALLILERLTWIGEQPITFARLAHPPGRRISTTL